MEATQHLCLAHQVLPAFHTENGPELKQRWPFLAQVMYFTRPRLYNMYHYIN